jgi:hypothetical protein
LVERKGLQDILNELNLQITGLVDEENATKVGKFIGAKMLIIGKLYANNYDRYDLLGLSINTPDLKIRMTAIINYSSFKI